MGKGVRSVEGEPTEEFEAGPFAIEDSAPDPNVGARDRKPCCERIGDEAPTPLTRVRPTRVSPDCDYRGGEKEDRDLVDEHGQRVHQSDRQRPRWFPRVA